MTISTSSRAMRLHATNEGVLAHHCVLVAPTWVREFACRVGLELREVYTELPDPPGDSGLLVCTADTCVHTLPPGWTGVWARSEASPSGPWVPLPSALAQDPQAMCQALRAAEAWRHERLGFAQQDVDRAAALKAVNEIGIALSAERHPTRLLDMVLSRARHLVAADAGSLYLVEKDKGDTRHLRFALAQNDSVEAPWKESLLSLNPHSAAGAVALSGEVVVIDDAYALPADGPLRHDRSFDLRFGYRTCSIVGIPLLTREGDVLGVLQLINRKALAGVPLAEPTTATEVFPFSVEDVELLRSLASQAAVSLENSRLYEDIQHLFEGFVRAAVTTIEQRDPTTSGHSFRVADGTLALAQRVERLGRGQWAGVRFSREELRELRYAALLHDFGKVAVREPVLTKSLKLYEAELLHVHNRFQIARATHSTTRIRSWLQEMLQDPEDFRQRFGQYEQELHQELAEFDAMLRVVLAANQPNVMEEGDFSALEAIRQRLYVDLEGQTRELLTDKEVFALSIRRGNLTPEERVEIEKHVVHSFNFLRTIPWTKELARVPELAGKHHEKLDGSGYPFGLTAPEIPLGTRMMTIADIYDALTARDRPYKKAIPLERALNILEGEARSGKLDAELVQLWIDSKAWEAIGTY